MRNLKRALSLTLASIMLLGMMVVGSSAASYQDVTDEHNVEAIEVLQAVGIMVGDEGNFNPDKNVTRNEMAVIMSNLMDYRVASYSGTSPFTDVPAWAEPYVAACYTNGITSGTSPTTYNGSGNVTTAQAALMIMKALGYFQYASDFKDDWMLETTRQAGKIDLLVDVKAGVRDAMTRNDVAQLVLNGLKTGMVEVDDSNKVEVSNGDMQVSVGGAKYVYVTSREKYAKAIYDTKVGESASSSADLAAPIVELGEKLYQGDLTLRDWKYDKDSNPDDFGRPSRTWTYQAKDIGTYAEEADIVFTASVTSKALYNAVGSTAAEKYTWTIKNNGETVYSGADKKGFPEMVKNQTNDSDDFFNKASGAKTTTGTFYTDNLYSDKEDLTGNGVLTEIFLDGNKETVTVSVTDFYAAEVYQVKDGKISLSSIEADAPADTSYEFDATGFEEDEVVYYTFAKDKIQSVAKADRIEGEVTRVVANTADANGKNFNLDGENYKYLYTMDTNDALTTENVANNMVGYTMTLGDKAYCMYVDWAAVTYDYAYVLSAGFDDDKADNTGKDQTVWARLVLTDGSMLTVETDNKAKSGKAVDDGLDYLRNHIVSYSKNTNGVYTLKVKDDASDITAGTNGAVDVGLGTDIFENGRSKVDDGSRTWTANNNTMFIVAESGDSWGDYSFSVYTGVENIPDIAARSAKTKVCVAATDKGVAKVVFVQDADVSGNGNVIFVIANKKADTALDKDGTRYYSLTAYENGEKIEFNVKHDSDAYDTLVAGADVNFGKGGAYEAISLGNSTTKFVVPIRVVTLNSDDLVTSVKLYEKSTKDGYIYGTGTTKNDNGAVGLTGNGSWYVLKDARQIRYDVDDDAYSVSSISSVKKSTKDQYIGVIDDGDLIGLFVVDYAEEGGDTPAPGDDTYEVTVNLDANSVVMNGDKAVANGDKISVKKGETLTLTITAKDGYTVEVKGATKGTGDTYTVSAAGIVTVTATEKNDKIKLNVKLNADDVAAGIKITEARVLEASDIVSNKYNNVAAAEGDIWITLDVPSNVSVGSNTNAATLTGDKNGMTVVIDASSDGQTKYVHFGKTNADKLDLTAELTLSKLVSSVTRQLEVKNGTDMALKFAAATTGVSQTTGGNLKLNITEGLPAWASEVKVTYTVTNLKEGTLTAGDAEGTYVATVATEKTTDKKSAKFSNEKTLCADAKADPKTTGNVVLTVTDVKVTKTKAELKGATASGLEITCDGTTQWTLPTLTLDPVPSAQVSKATANVTLTGVTPVTSGDLSIDYADSAVSVAGDKTQGQITVGTHRYTCDGTKPVTITVTSKVTGLKQSGTFAAMDGTTTVTGITLGGAVKVKDGANEKNITLTLAKADFGNNKIVKVKIVAGATGAKVFESAATAGSGTVGSATVTIGAGELTGITGGKIYVEVTIEDKPAG